MPSMLRKRRDGSLTPFRHSEYIPFYYFIPKSILSRCGAELNSIPRNPQKLLHDSAACDFVESDLFMLLIYDATAYMVQRRAISFSSAFIAKGSCQSSLKMFLPHSSADNASFNKLISRTRDSI